ncbi:Lipase (class 3), putative, partial [Leishmania lindenbergi]
TGRSLGGAIAILAAADLQRYLNGLKNTSKLVSVETLGPARVSQTVFAKLVGALLKGSMYCLIPARDPAMRLPALIWGYMHGASEVLSQTLANNSVVVCSDSPDRKVSKHPLRVLSLWVDDHLCYMGDTVEGD